jgi:hypothetical protein
MGGAHNTSLNLGGAHNTSLNLHNFLILKL